MVPTVRVGMSVFSADGEKLGNVVRRDADSFIIEKGLFFPKDYLCHYADVASVAGDDVRLSVNREELVRLRDAKVERDDVREAGVSTGAGAVDSPSGPTRAAAGTSDGHIA
jgi:hypothetical protein